MAKQDGTPSSAIENADARSLEDHDQETARRYKEEYPWSDQLAVEIGVRLVSARLALGGAVERRVNEIAPGSFARFGVLRTLQLAPGQRMTQKEISQRQGVTSGNVTRLIDGLERDGLVKRSANDSDRRLTYVELTQAGKELGSQLLPAVARFSAQVCSAFTDAEKRQLRDLLRRYKSYVTRALEGDPADSDRSS